MQASTVSGDEISFVFIQRKLSPSLSEKISLALHSLTICFATVDKIKHSCFFITQYLYDLYCLEWSVIDLETIFNKCSKEILNGNHSSRFYFGLKISSDPKKLSLNIF